MARLLSDKRVWAAGIALALIVAGFIPWPMPHGKVERALAYAFRTGGGTTLKIGRRPSFAILPSPRVIVRDLSVDYRNGSVRARIENARIGLDPLSLLVWKVSPTSAVLDGLDAQTTNGTDSPLDLFKDVLAIGGSEPLVPGLAQLSVMNGRLQLATNLPENGLIDRLNVQWLPANPGETFHLEADGVWRGEAVDIDVSGPAGQKRTPLSKTPASLELKSRLLAMRFSGHVMGGGEPKLDGDIEARADDGGELARWLGVPQPLPGRIAQFRLTGALSATARQLAFSNATIGFNGDNFDGVIGLQLAGARPAITATLETASADLSEQFGVLLPRRAAEGGWSQERFDLDSFNLADFDLRLSAKKLQIAGLPFEKVALSLLLNSRRLEMSLAEATLLGGATKGRLTAVAGEAGMTAKGMLDIDAIDAGALMSQAFGSKRLGGRGTLQIGAEATGASTAALVQSLSGTLAMKVSDGALLGVDLDRFLVRLERRSLIASSLDIPTGTTRFESGTLTARATQGRIEIGEGLLQSPTLSIRFGGSADAPNRVLDINGEVASAEKTGHTATLPFVIRGTWDSPRLSQGPDGKKKF